YTGNTMALMALGQMNMSGGGASPSVSGISGMSQYGGMANMYGGNAYAQGYGANAAYGANTPYGQGGYPGSQPVYQAPLGAQAPAGANQPGTVGATGTYLGNAPPGYEQTMQKIPHVIPNPFDNTLLIQGTPQEYEQITNLLRQLDIAPRQVLIDAKIYEVDLSGAFSAGVTAFLEKK